MHLLTVYLKPFNKELLAGWTDSLCMFHLLPIAVMSVVIVHHTSIRLLHFSVKKTDHFIFV